MKAPTILRQGQSRSAQMKNLLYCGDNTILQLQSLKGNYGTKLTMQLIFNLLQHGLRKILKTVQVLVNSTFYDSGLWYKCIETVVAHLFQFIGFYWYNEVCVARLQNYEYILSEIFITSGT